MHANCMHTLDCLKVSTIITHDTAICEDPIFSQWTIYAYFKGHYILQYLNAQQSSHCKCANFLQKISYLGTRGQRRSVAHARHSRNTRTGASVGDVSQGRSDHAAIHAGLQEIVKCTNIRLYGGIFWCIYNMSNPFSSKP